MADGEAVVPTGDENDPMATLSTDELESWTLLDSSPRRSPNPSLVQMEKKSKKTTDKDHPSRVEDEEEDVEEEEEVSEAESASEEEEEDEQEQVKEEEEVKEKTSRVEAVGQEKGGSARDTTVQDNDGEQQQKKNRKSRKKRTDSERSVDSHDGFSSDSISVISESSDAEAHLRKVHLAKGIRLGSDQPLLPEVGNLSEQTQQLSQKPSSTSDESKQLVRPDSLVPWTTVGKTSVVLVGMVVTALVAILVGNSRTFTNRVDEYKFEHEQRISELELENNILKNEMNKLKHLYTRSELDEQVQQADVEWEKVLDEKLTEEQAQEQVEPEPMAEPEPEPTAEPDTPAEEPLVFRKVPPQDDNIKRRVVWSGDDGLPMLIADKDYVLPDFCYNQNAVQDDLFSEYSSKYCDIKKRKVEAKLRKAEFARKNYKRYKEPKDYTEYIIPTQEEIEEYQMKAQLPLPKPPSLSPFHFDYKKAFETIKEESAVIVDSLVAILDLDPEPEYIPTPTPSSSSVSDGDQNQAYQADDEASPSPTSSSTETLPEEIRWESYPPWVKEKYANQPEMHGKLRNKESLLWDWERKKNDFLHEVGLDTLEEVDRKSENELRLRREEFRSKNPGQWKQQQQSGEYRRKEGGYKERKHDGGRKEEFRGGERKQYDERRGTKEQRYDERKEWKDRARSSGENRSREHKNHQNNQHQNNGKPQQQQQPWKNDSDENQRKSAEYHGESSKEWKNSKESGESSGGGKPYHKKEWKDSGERRNGKPYYKKDSRESSGEGSGGKPYYKKDWKNGSGERNGKQWKRDDSEEHHSGEHHGKRKDFSDERKDGKKQGGPKRNGDQWNWSKDADDSGEDHSGEGSYLSQFRQSDEDHHHKKGNRKFEGIRNFRDDDDDDDDDDDHHKKHHSKEDHHRKHHKDDDHWKKGKKHHDGDRKWQEHSQERRR